MESNEWGSITEIYMVHMKNLKNFPPNNIQLPSLKCNSGRSFTAAIDIYNWI